MANASTSKSLLGVVIAFANVNIALSGIYTGEKTLYVVAIAGSGDLKRWENFY